VSICEKAALALWTRTKRGSCLAQLPTRARLTSRWDLAWWRWRVNGSYTYCLVHYRHSWFRFGIRSCLASSDSWFFGCLPI